MSNPTKLNYVVLHDGSFYRVFERLGKNVPFSAYNTEKHLGIGTTFEEALDNTSIPIWMIEEDPVEVMFNV